MPSFVTVDEVLIILAPFDSGEEDGARKCERNGDTEHSQSIPSFRIRSQYSVTIHST
ncbi:hypothetical protein K503DRAFT_765734 [Rhizopogon vinicolor AM-OR11-026]|uniref:Uncharacterized protein n=1 Tax=Rhizopogon vinicolor AM-OR11-026 TaxID=1314800 RepID=A0A1B7NF77_9AGAM|nr:hypothetical protein K503DRAFT_765734 [Rhizopogon vinicolor AM-OR11-026]